MSPHKKLNRVVFTENLRLAALPVLIFLLFSAGLAVFFLNVPVSSEKLPGKIIRNSLAPDGKSVGSILTFIQLDNGRTVFVSLPYSANLPREGESVLVTRYIKRFFGDSFGLER
jgi:hypothetical protein